MSLQVATQFKNSLTSLIEILMSKEPSYVRCIKPNEDKEPGKGCIWLNVNANWEGGQGFWL